MRLQGKKVIVTGGASGIGLAIVRRFSREGAMVCTADIQQSPNLTSPGIKFSSESGVYFFETDVSDQKAVNEMLDDAIEVESQFAEDVLSGGVAGMSTADTRTYLEFVADQRLAQLGLPKRYGSKNPFDFMELQDVQELTNFFERTVAAYQHGVEGDVAFDEDF